MTKPDSFVMNEPQDVPTKNTEIDLGSSFLRHIARYNFKYRLCICRLELGFSIGGSTVAAITGYALLRGVLKKEPS